MDRLSSSEAQTTPDDALFGDIAAYLTVDARERFGARIGEYLLNIPEVDTSPDYVDFTLDGSQEAGDGIELSFAATFAGKAIQNNEKQTQDAKQTFYKKGSVAGWRKVAEELRACGINDGELFDDISTEFSDCTALLLEQLEDKSLTYADMMRLYSSDPDIHAQEIIERMQDAVQAAHTTVLSSEEVPNEPKNRSILRKSREAESRQWHEAWNQSKQKLVDGIELPSRDDILHDIMQGGDAAMRRMIYGSRRLVLDRGAQSDLKDEIDSYQRRYIGEEVFGDEYLIALSPEEWLQSEFDAAVSDILFGENNVFAGRIDEAVANDSGRQRTRQHRKTSPYARRSNFGSTQNHGYRSAQEDDAYHNSGRRYTGESHHTGDNHALSPLAQQAASHISTLLDSHIGRRMSRHERQNAISHLEETLDGIDESFLEKWSQDPSQYTQRLVRQLLVASHPDSVGLGKEEVAKIYSELFASIKSTDKKQEV